MSAGRFETAALRLVAACGAVAGVADRVVVAFVRYPALLVVAVIAVPTWFFSGGAVPLIVFLAALGLMWASFLRLDRRDIDADFGIGPDRAVAGGSVDGALVAGVLLAAAGGLLLSYQVLGDASTAAGIAAISTAVVLAIGRSAGYVAFRADASPNLPRRDTPVALGAITPCRVTGLVFGPVAVTSVRVASARVPRPMRPSDELIQAAGRIRVVDGRASIARVPLGDAAAPAVQVPSMVGLFAGGGGTGLGSSEVLTVEAGTAYRVVGPRPAIRMTTARLGRLLVAFRTGGERDRWLGEIVAAAGLRVQVDGVAAAPRRV